MSVSGSEIQNTSRPESSVFLNDTRRAYHDIGNERWYLGWGGVGWGSNRSVFHNILQNSAELRKVRIRTPETLISYAKV